MLQNHCKTRNPGCGHGSFPLTPALSLREREQRALRVLLWRPPVWVIKRTAILPLPEGEGWGEGEEGVRNSKCSDVCNDVRNDEIGDWGVGAPFHHSICS